MHSCQAQEEFAETLEVTQQAILSRLKAMGRKMDPYRQPRAQKIVASAHPCNNFHGKIECSWQEANVVDLVGSE
ncbi:hypothetical protein RB195_024169 [Necator americanus]|uniref:Uncharacterized protein n=1 Tax=Necator americanus TaxID=51031 RepID=A0ABR1EM80_NECAM